MAYTVQLTSNLTLACITFACFTYNLASNLLKLARCSRVIRECSRTTQLLVNLFARKSTYVLCHHYDTSLVMSVNESIDTHLTRGTSVARLYPECTCRRLFNNTSYSINCAHFLSLQTPLSGCRTANAVPKYVNETILSTCNILYVCNKHQR